MHDANVHAHSTCDPLPAVLGARVLPTAAASPQAPDAKEDPSAWFYQNQIKSEAEFKVKKDAERAEDRKRLEQVRVPRGGGRKC